MTAEDTTMQALRKQVSELTLRLKELGEEHRDLREICNERGIQSVSYTHLTLPTILRV